MAQWIRALVALLENPVQFPAPTWQPKTVTPVAENRMFSSDCLWHQAHINTYRPNTHTHNKKNKKN